MSQPSAPVQSSYASVSHDLLPADSKLARFCGAQRTRRITLGLIVLVTLLLTISPTVLRGQGPESFDAFWRYFIDFDVYREGGAAFAHGENLYTQDYSVGGITLPFTYPPLAAAFFVPFSWVSVNFGGSILGWLSIAALWWILVLVARTVFPSWSRESIVGLALLMTLVGTSFEPVVQTISFGQINILLCLLVTIDLLARRTWLPRGFLIGLAAALKLTPAVFGLYFLVRRDWKAAGWSLASGIGWSLFAWLIAAESSREYWLHTLHDPSRIGGLAYAANQSFRGVYVRIFSEDTAATIWLITVFIVIALVAYVMYGFIQRQAYAAAMVINALIALLCSPVSWSHHWVWAVPMILVLGSYAASFFPQLRSTLLWVATSFGAFFFIACLHWKFPHSGNQELLWSVSQQILGASYVCGNFAALVISAVLLWRIGLHPQPQSVSATQRQEPEET
ncbi:MAG: glycosyltransferase 87 family protein [Corynebacterium sp.]|nr:glycosyltransferase 87 family protein [Corynebacterium sp.]